MIKQILAAAVVMALPAHAQGLDPDTNMLRVQNILQHMARMPFGPKFLPPGFSGGILHLQRTGADAPIQFVKASMTPASEVTYQLFARSVAKQFLTEFGGAPMMGEDYTAAEDGSMDVQGTGRQRPFTVKCWSGRNKTSGGLAEEVCASAIDPQIILVAKLFINTDSGHGSESDSAHMQATSLAVEGLSYWMAIDDQMENEFLGRLTK